MLSLLITVFFLCLPVSAFAAHVYLQTASTTIAVGDTIVVHVLVDTEHAPVNLVQGTILVNGPISDVTVSDLSIAGSVLSLWVRTPSLDTDSTISFVGGEPDGFTSSGAEIFKIILLAKKPGTIILDPSDISVYLNDGKATLASVQDTPLDLTIEPARKGVLPTNQWAGVLNTDTTAPQPFVITLGSDPSVFGGEQFIAWDTADAGSGIDHYEVTEGNLPPVKSSSPYVLQHQHTSESIVVTAYDKAGNARTTTYHTSSSFGGVDIFIIAMICIIVAVLYVTRRTPRHT